MAPWSAQCLELQAAQCPQNNNLKWMHMFYQWHIASWYIVFWMIALKSCKKFLIIFFFFNFFLTHIVCERKKTDRIRCTPVHILRTKVEKIDVGRC